MTTVSVPISLNHVVGGLQQQQTISDCPRTAPVRIGVPFKRGELKGVERLTLRSEKGVPIPMQARALLTWPDGSVRWALIDFLPDLKPSSRERYWLEESETEPSLPEGLTPVRIEESEDSVVIDNGHLRFALSKRRFSLFQWLTLDVVAVIAEGSRSDLITVDTHGQRHYASCDRDFAIEIEERGPIHTVIKVTGRHLSQGRRGRLLDFQLRYHVYAGCRALKLEHAFINRQPPERGMEVRSISAMLTTALDEENTRTVRLSYPAQGTIQAEVEPFVEISENVSLRAYPNKFCVEIENPAQLGLDDRVLPVFSPSGWENTVRPYVDVRDKEKGLLAFFREMQANNPKELASDGNTLEFHFWPAWAEPLSLTRGMSKRHWMVLIFHRADLSKEGIEATFRDWDDRLNMALPPERYRECQVDDVQNILPYLPMKYPKLERTLARVFAINWPMGMKNYGDGAAFGETVIRPTSWINNEEDFPRAAFWQYMRTGDYGYFMDGQTAARHLIDIDFVDSSDDPLREGGVVAHSPNHTDWNVFPSHMWIDGLLLYHALTGDPDALRVTKAVGDNLLRWIELRPEAVFRTGRETGRPLRALSALYDYLHNERYLQGTQPLIAEYRRRFVAEDGLWYRLDGKRMLYAEWSALEGLYRYWVATGDQTAPAFAMEIVNWMVRNTLDTDGMYDQMGGSLPGFIPFHLGYVWTGDEKYIAMGKPGLRHLLSMPAVATTLEAAQRFNLTMHYLRLADERGLIDDTLLPMGGEGFRFRRWEAH